jgi:hypothetical protein
MSTSNNNNNNRSRTDSIDTTKSKSNLVQVAEGYSRKNAVIKGYLKKRNSNGKWQKRYFEIVGQYFVYYKNKESDEMLCAMDLWRASAPERIKSKDNDDNEKDKDCDFAITWDRFREFRAPSSKDADDWVKYMLQVQAKRPDADRRPNVAASVAAKVVGSPDRRSSLMNGNETNNLSSSSSSSASYGSNTTTTTTTNGKVTEWSSPEKATSSKKKKESEKSNSCCIIM